MQQPQWKWNRLPGAGALALAAIAVLSTPAPSHAQQQNQKTFPSAQEATTALVAAVKNNDEKAMIEILGPDAKRIVSSGDDTQDAQDRTNFVDKYQQMHRFMKEPDGETTLYVGAENWPTPIPLVEKNGAWHFDTEGAKKEILYRRIGENELSAMRICQELVAAQKDYHSTEHEKYAEKIFSDPGQHNGLSWKAATGAPQSPIGPLVAAAVAEGYAQSRDGSPVPYRGYFYHILTAQGPDAPGGAKSYLVDGKMTGGFAFIAYPAEYRSSGVMTFVVGQDGVVYQKDLGKQTDSMAKAMKDYNPGPTWKKAQHQEE